VPLPRALRAHPLRLTREAVVHGGCGTNYGDIHAAIRPTPDRAGLPRPEVNVWIGLPHGGRAQADFLWREQRLIVETDGRAAHGTRRAFEHDRRRDQGLVLAGWRVIRVTWRQLTREPEGLARIVAELHARKT
jgi:hypothetical protein